MRIPILSPAVDPYALGHENFLEFVREQARLAGGEAVEADGVLMVAGPPGPQSAIDIAARLDADADAADVIATTTAFYGERGRCFMLYAREDTEADVARAAEAAGLVPLLREPQMECTERPPDAEPPPGVEIHRVSESIGVERFAGIMSEGYADAGLSRAEAAMRFAHPERWLEPHLHLFVATLDGEPVCSGLTFLGTQVAGTYLLSTVPDARGRGIGRAVITRMTQAGFDAGAPLVVLQSSWQGEALYRRLGYRGVFLSRGFFWNAPEARM